MKEVRKIIENLVIWLVVFPLVIVLILAVISILLPVLFIILPIVIILGGLGIFFWHADINLDEFEQDD